MNTSDRKTLGEYVCEALIAEGIEYVFGIPGSHTLGIYEALRRYAALRHVNCTHEASAATMADVYGRLTGKPAAVLVTAGPGATNSLTAIARAYRAHSPVIHLSGAPPTDSRRGAFHGLDHNPLTPNMFREVTKWSASLENLPDLPRLLSLAAASCRSQPTGPVHLALPQNWVNHPPVHFSPYVPAMLEAEPHQDLSAVRAALAQAQRPLIWAGIGVQVTGAQALLQELAEYLQAPVIVADDASGAMPDIHPLATGQLSLYTQTPLQLELLRQSDLILAVGFRPHSYHADTLFRLAEEISVIGLWFAAEQGEPEPRAVHQYWGSTDTLLHQLIAGWNQPPRAQPTKLLQHIHQGKTLLRRSILNKASTQPQPAGRMHVATVLNQLIERLDPSSIILGDVGEHNQWTRLAIQSQTPHHYISEGFWGAMGFALPAAIAAKLVYPEKQVVGITGDGCMLMGAGDITTAVALGLAPIIVVLNDSCYGMISHMQQQMYEATTEVGLGAVDFAAMAKAQGANGIKVTQADQLEDAINQALQSKTLFLIDAHCAPPTPTYQSPDHYFSG